MGRDFDPSATAGSLAAATIAAMLLVSWLVFIVAAALLSVTFLRARPGGRRAGSGANTSDIAASPPAELTSATAGKPAAPTPDSCRSTATACCAADWFDGPAASAVR